MADAKPNLYGLFVGINQYEFLAWDKQLNACRSDARLIRDYFDAPGTRAQFDKVDLKLLLDNDESEAGAPKKANVVQKFQEQLGQVQPGDVAVFYFSGHGVREKSEIPMFQASELDGNLGGIVMTDFADPQQSHPGDTVICDKELRHLIKWLSDKGTREQPVRILTLFDCCHSGENTRATLSPTLPRKSRQIERAPVKARRLEQFIFSADADLKQRLAQPGDLDEVMPQGDHVMLAACREIELAWEGDNNHGQFTHALVDILNKHPEGIGFQELHSRLLNRMRFVVLEDQENDDGVTVGDAGNDYRQTPQFYYHTRNSSDRYRLFPSFAANTRPTGGALEYNRDENEWRLAAGALHGVPVDAYEETEIQVFAVGDSTPIGTGYIEQVYPTHATVDLEQLDLDASKAYRGSLEGIAVPRTRVSVIGVGGTVAQVQAALSERLEKAANSWFELVDDGEDPEFVVNCDPEAVQICEAGLQPLPRVAALPLSEPQAMDLLFAELMQIGNWCMLRDLEYEGDFEAPDASYEHPEYPVAFKAYEYDPTAQQERELPLQDGNLILELTPEKKKMLVRFELMNRSNQELLVSLIYMSHLFGFYTRPRSGVQLMHSSQLGLGPLTQPQAGLGENHVQSSRFGKRAPNGKKYVEFATGGYIHKDNWRGVQEYLKLLISEVPFDVEPLHLSDLPHPGQRRSRDASRWSMASGEKELPKWALRTISLYVTNPHYTPEAATAAT